MRAGNHFRARLPGLASPQPPRMAGDSSEIHDVDGTRREGIQR